MERIPEPHTPSEILVILNYPMASHLVPMVGFLQYFKKQGLSIDFFGPLELGEKHLKDVATNMTQITQEAWPSDPVQAQEMRFKRYFLPILYDIPKLEGLWEGAGKKPKLIISDFFAPITNILVQRHPEIKLVSFFSTFVITEAILKPEHLDLACPASLTELNNLMHERYNYRIRDYMDIMCTGGRIVSMIPVFWAEPIMPPDFDRSKYIGPGLRDEDIEIKRDGPAFFGENEEKKLIYVSFGTSHMAAPNDWLYLAIIEALKESDYNVLLSTGKRDVKILDGVDVPKNMKIEVFVPQLRVLEKASLFITHGGAGGLIETLVVGTPVICVPIFGDQPANALAVDKLKIGKQLKVSEAEDRPTTLKMIQNNVQEIIENYEYRQNCLKYGKEINPQKSKETFYGIVSNLLSQV